MDTQDFLVTGMSCGGCEASVRDAVSQIPGVTGVEVNANSGRLVVTAEDSVDDAVISAVGEAGYQALIVQQ